MTVEPLYTREGVATLLRQFYWEKMSAVLRQVGREYKPNPRHDSKEQWLRNADNCLSVNANPHDFVEAVFALSPGKYHPMAKDLAGIFAKNYYLDWKRTNSELETRGTTFSAMQGKSGLEEDIKFRMVQVCRIMFDQTGFTEPWRNVRFMMDDWCLLRDWPDIRVALAGKHNMRECVRKYAPAAREYLQSRPYHVEVYRKLGYDLTAYLNNYGTA